MIRLTVLVISLFVVAASAPVAAQSGGPMLGVPGSIDAGQELVVELTASVPDDTIGELVVIGGMATVVEEVSFSEGLASHVFADPSLLRAGAVTVVGRVDGAQVTASVAVLPGPATAPLQPSVSPNRVMAGPDGSAISVALLEDRYGNVVDAGTELSIAITRPDGTREEMVVPTRAMVAVAELAAGQVAGEARVEFKVGEVESQVFYDVVPGPPVSYRLLQPDRVPRATGLGLLSIESQRLTDEFGNQLLDGQAVLAVIEDGDGAVRQVAAQVIGGRASVGIPVPSTPSVRSVVFIVDGVASEPLTIDFEDLR